jgi:DoxX-like protein
MMLVVDLLSAVLVFVFGSAAVAKLVRQRRQVQTAEKLRIPWHRYRWIAVPEAAAAIGLLAGFERATLGAAAAVGLVAVMTGALAFRLRVRDSAGFLLGDAALLSLAAATAMLRITT